MLKNITLSAEEELVEKARLKARKERTTLNAAFRQWLKHYANAGTKSQDYEALMKTLNYAHPGKTFSRDELNER